MTSFAGISIHTLLMSRFITHHHLKDKNKSYNYLKMSFVNTYKI